MRIQLRQQKEESSYVLLVEIAHILAMLPKQTFALFNAVFKNIFNPYIWISVKIRITGCKINYCHWIERCSIFALDYLSNCILYCSWIITFLYYSLLGLEAKTQNKTWKTVKSEVSGDSTPYCFFDKDNW